VGQARSSSQIQLAFSDESRTLAASVGLACLVIVVFTHVAETLHLLPGMRWGLPNSPGHHFDLLSAALGCGLLIAGALVSAFPSNPALGLNTSQPPDQKRAGDNDEENSELHWRSPCPDS
jgi:hypothetical protein